MNSKSFIKYWPIPLLILTALALILLEKWYVLAIPLVVGLGVYGYYNFKAVFFLLYMAIPLSVEYDLPNGSKIDLFSDPLMIIFSGVFVVLLVSGKFHRINYLKHPAYYLVAAHLLYLLFTVFYSENSTVSLKYFLAKIWFLLSLFFLPSILRISVDDVKKIVSLMAVCLVFIVIDTTIRHAQYGFTFEMASKWPSVFFLNHVGYSMALGMAFPFLLFVYKESPKDSLERLVWKVVIFMFLVGIVLSYTRATWLSVLVLPFFFILFKKNWLKYAALSGVMVLVFASAYLIYDDNYLKYAPEYEQTVFYRDSFKDHMGATFEMKDVSGMERIYRWVAAVKMFAQSPIMGTGPNTFYPLYYNYTVSAFETYTSDNPERSTTHNYFLLLLSEQGIIGFILFSGFFFLVAKKAQISYLKEENTSKKNLLLACAGCLFIAFLHLLLNDMIEVDKIAGLFFLSCSLILQMGNKYKVQR